MLAMKQYTNNAHHGPKSLKPLFFVCIPTDWDKQHQECSPSIASLRVKIILSRPITFQDSARLLSMITIVRQNMLRNISANAIAIVSFQAAIQYTSSDINGCNPKPMLQQAHGHLLKTVCANEANSQMLSMCQNNEWI